MELEHDTTLDSTLAPESSPEAPETAGEAGADAEVAAETTGDGNEAAPEKLEPAPDAEVAPAPARREVGRGIHPELMCNCEECDPEFTELQWFSPEEKKKVKGSLLLYCQRSGRKYHTPASDLHTWLAANPTKGGRSKE